MKYVTLILGVGLLWLQSSFGWVLSENEAIAATQQVKSGMDWAEGRTLQTAYASAYDLIRIGGSLLILASGFFFVRDLVKKQNLPPTQP